MKSVDVCLTHQQLENYDHREKVVVVIDVLRATSTMNTLLFNGVNSVTPVETLEECMSLRNEGFIIMAERMGKKVNGFDYGNSPSKISRENFEGREVAIATSNGTKAIVKTKGSHITIIGSFLNIGSISEYINSKDKDTILLCSGWKGSTNLEDTLCAGAVISKLSNHEIISDSGYIAKKLFKKSGSDILTTMKESSHAKRLSGYDNNIDIEFCSQIDSQPIISVFEEGKLKLL